MEAAPRKHRVTWTQHEETQIALEIQRMRRGEVDRRWPSGHEAVSLPSQINLAMTRLLDKSRHKSSSAVYTTKGNYDEAWLQGALARASIYKDSPVAKVEEPVPQVQPEIPEPPVDPEVEQLVVLGSLVQQLSAYIGAAITKGVKQALIELRDEEERNLRDSGDYTSPPSPVPTTAREIVKRKIDVIGLQPIQRAIVEKSPVARWWNIRFLQSGHDHGQAHLRDRVIICSKFVSHQQQNRYRQMKAEIRWANGGAMSVIKELEKLSSAGPTNSRLNDPLH